MLLRIEDHDRQRSRPELERAILDDLDWLGFEPDVYPTSAYRRGSCEARQSEREAIYGEAAQTLIDRGLVYGCACSRRDIEEALRRLHRPLPTVGASRVRGSLASDRKATGELHYPGTCRDRGIPPGDGVGWRLRTDSGVERFVDGIQGRQEQDPSRQCGDLLLRDRVGNWTYQFAVVVDDWQQGIDVVIRGLDLLASTGRQIRLGRELGRAVPPDFMHHALVMKSTPATASSPPQKLSKSDGDTGIAALRHAGWRAPQVIGHAASLVGLWPTRKPLELDRIADLFRL